MRTYFALVFCLATLGQQTPPRDVIPRREPTGTAIIRGAVVAADTGIPIRGATVSLLPFANRGPNASSDVAQLQPPVRPRQTTADAQGAFEFTDLPPGSYRLSASAGQPYAQYLNGAFGGKRPGDMGQPIQLADGQVFDKGVIALPRGGVVAGRVTDDAGQPLTRVQVYPLLFAAGSSRGMRTGGGIQTDDLGQFRLYGLQPGDYVVAAESRGDTFVSPNVVVDREQESTGLITTYYPGVADAPSAQRLRIAAGKETTGIEIRMLQGRLYHVSGSVVDSQGKPAIRTNGNLMQFGAGTSPSFGSGFSTDEQGRFQMKNIAPGNYRLIIRPVMTMVEGQPKFSGESASVPLVVSSDVEGLAIVTSPGATITGRIVFEGQPPAQPGQLRVFATPGETDFGLTPPAAIVQPDMTFTMKGLQGEYMLRAGVPNMYMKSVTTGADDVTDAPHEFKNGDRVTIVVTSRASTLEGTVTDSSGQPATNALVMLFPDDKAAWRVNSIRLHRASIDPDGHYRMRGVLAGRYYVVAGPRDRLAVPGPMSPTIFEELAKDATTVAIGEDEQRTVDLKVIESGGI